MAFLIVGLALLAMKMAKYGPVAGWAWHWVLLPFALAIAWWTFADKTGLTKRRAMQKMDRRKADRRQRSLEQLGLGTRGTPPAPKRSAPPASRTDPPAPRTPEPKRRDPRA